MNSEITANLPHHIREELCTTRPMYRQGKKLTSVKVYTVNKESQHLLVYNVPAINIDTELQALFQRYGTVTICERAPIQDVEDFTLVYHVRFEKVYEARLAKRKIDDMSFFGGVLHVCYAPELETVKETNEKLSVRRKEVSFHLRKLEFPQQFRPQRGIKRKFKHKTNENPLVFQQSDATSFSKQVPETHEYPAQPGLSHPQQNQCPVVDVKPFKKLIPTKIARIVFHKKNENKL